MFPTSHGKNGGKKARRGNKKNRSKNKKKDEKSNRNGMSSVSGGPATYGSAHGKKRKRSDEAGADSKHFGTSNNGDRKFSRLNRGPNRKYRHYRDGKGSSASQNRKDGKERSASMSKLRRGKGQRNTGSGSAASSRGSTLSKPGNSSRLDLQASLRRLQKQRVVEANKAMAQLANRKQLKEVREKFESLRNARLANDHSYAIIINACVRCGDLKSAIVFYAAMIQAGCASIQGVTAMIKGYSNLGDFERARNTFQNMQTMNPAVMPNVRTCNTFLRGCLMHGEIEFALELYNKMVSKDVWDIVPDASTVEYMVTLVCQGLKPHIALEIMQRAGLPSNTTTLQSVDPSLIVALCRAMAMLGRTKDCSTLVDQALSCLSGSSTWQDEAGSNSIGNNKKQAPLQQTALSATGGRRAWKTGDASRAFAAAKFAEHRQGELRREATMIKDWLSSSQTGTSEDNVKEEFDPAIASDILAAFKRLISFPVNFGQNLSRDETSSALAHALHSKFGVGEICSALESVASPSLSDVKSEVNQSLSYLRSHFSRCVSVQNHLDFQRLFGNDEEQESNSASNRRPLKLEICSGAGEWAAAQATKDKGTADWVTLELRHARVYQTFARMVFNGVRNMCVIGGDANLVVQHHIAPQTFDYVFINHPEPPQQTGNATTSNTQNDDSAESAEANSSQADHLLTAHFLGTLVARILAPRGLLCICSDNHWYAQMLCNILGSSPVCSTKFTSLTPKEARLKLNEQISGVNLFLGVPGRSCGVPDSSGASSYFDRMFQSGLSSHASAFDRYTICIRKKG